MGRHSKCRIDENGRECTVCGEYKEWEYFYKSKVEKTGYCYACKECMKEYREQNKNKIKEYREQNKDRIKEYHKEHYTQSAKYSTYASQLSYAQYVEEGKDDNLVIKCTYCGKKYIPTIRQVRNRINALNGIVEGESNIYCSNACKHACPTYKQKEYRKDQKPDIAYETLDPYVRQEVFKRDDYKCQKCGKTNNKSTNPLHCHHINPKKLDPLLANDIDNLITLCKKCHIKTHQEIEGCGFKELADCK